MNTVRGGGGELLCLYGGGGEGTILAGNMCGDHELM